MGDSENTQGNNHIDFEYAGDPDITNFAGERRHIKFGPASETDGQDGTYKYNGILTCLKPDAKLYSFSILIDNDNDDILSSFIKTLSKSNDIKIVNKKNTESIYNFTNSITDLNNVFQGTNDNYMLIIGKLEDDKRLTVLKIILISNNNIGASINTDKYYTEILTAEEYLNLYYIEHFSLNIPKFIKDKYAPYKIIIDEKSTSLGTGEPAEGVREDERDVGKQKEDIALKEANGLANSLTDKVMQDELKKFQDSEGADGSSTVGPAPGDNGNGEIADGPATVVPGSIPQGGGKKLAKVKKNKKNKVV
jgi:hypothetical protein